ncbi:MAG TPA: metal-dependent hydrolase [Candidatus Kapabacteria bacterium]|nr:metal-dependent hydrolase [Candidatus Kapabacteria bacterium]
MSASLTLTFLGHSAWLIRHGDDSILIDPFVTGNPHAPVPADQLEPTAILLTHGHGDHLGDTEAIAKRTGAPVITTFEVANYLRARGCENTIGMGIGGGRAFGFGHVKFTIAHHSSSTPDGAYCGSPAGILLTLGGRTIYHAGDTGLFYDMKLIGDRNAIDVALLPIGDFFTMGVEDAVVAVEFLHPKLTVPMHYNTFPPIEVDAHDFVAKIADKGFAGLVMDPGASHSL